MTSLGVFDLETTGIDVDRDRIVSAFVGVLDIYGEPVPGLCRSWLVNPGIEIPPQATAIHGISTGKAIQDGADPAVAVEEIAHELHRLHEAGYPLAGFNLAYDLTLLDREIRRHEAGVVGDIGGPGGLWWDPAPVLDALILDKACDRYRKGSRRLPQVAEHYGVPLGENAHGAEADAVAAGRVVQEILRGRRSETKQLRSALDGVDPDRYPTEAGALHAWSRKWAEQQADSLADYFRRTGKHAEAATVRTEWPLVPYREVS